MRILISIFNRVHTAVNFFSTLLECENDFDCDLNRICMTEESEEFCCQPWKGALISNWLIIF